MDVCVKVSVIIPVFNSEKYLRDCLDTVLAQTLKEIEVICVDDGSTDGSLNIIREYAKYDSRVSVLTQSNVYAGVARNNGFENASGKYVIFLDSDDFFHPEMLEKTYQKAETTCADVVIFDGQKYDESEGKFLPVKHFLNLKRIGNLDVFSRHDIPDEIMLVTNPAPWNKLIRREFMEREDIRFQSLQNTNDAYATMMCLCLAEHISCIPEKLINYRVGIPSGDHVQGTKEKYPLCFIDALCGIYDELNSRGVYQEIEKSFVAFANSVCAYNVRSAGSEITRDCIVEALNSDKLRRMNLLNRDDSYYRSLTDVKYLIGSMKTLEMKKTLCKGVPSDDSKILASGRGQSGIPDVSVVIPVYDCDAYIGATLRSIQAQTLRNIEIICINDGSNDDSLSLLVEASRYDERIVVISQTNHGLSISRNVGLRHAHGKYLYYMDSDDLLEPEALMILFERMEKDSLDILFFDGSSFSDEESDDLRPDIERYSTFYSRRNDYGDEFYKGVDLLIAMEKNGEYRTSPCLQISRREFLIENNLTFFPFILHEDNLYTFCSMIRAARAGYVHKSLFKRRVRSGSIMTSEKTFKNAYGYFICYINMLKEFEKLHDTVYEEVHICNIMRRCLKNVSEW